MKPRSIRSDWDARILAGPRAIRRRAPEAEPRLGSSVEIRSRPVLYSFVIPIRDREARVERLHDQIVNMLGDQAVFEIIFIDDGSHDGSWRAVNELVARDPVRVRGLRFRRHLGTSAGLSAGFRAARGDVIVSLNPDSPIDPCIIPRFFEKLAEGHDIVSARKPAQRGRWHQELSRRVVTCLLRRLLWLPRPDLDTGFHCFRAEAVKDLTLYGEHYRMLPTMLAMQGYKSAEIEIDSDEEPGRRDQGRMGRKRSFSGLLDGLTVSFLYKYQERPSHLIGGISATFILFGASSIALGTALLYLRAEIAGLVSLIFGSNLLICAFFGFLWGLLAELMIRDGDRIGAANPIVEDTEAGPSN